MTAHCSCPRAGRRMECCDPFAELAAARDDELDDEAVLDDEPPEPWPPALATGVGPTSDADDFGEESFP